MFLTQKRTRSRQSTLSYGYDARGELVSAISDVNPDYAYGYGFDEAGNRNSASEAGAAIEYSTNALNQYASVSEGEVPFVPEYDLDGNATRLRTSTGEWSVEYNAHNRPVAWRKSTGEIIYMMYDRLGRRAEKRVLNASGKRTLRERYVYVGYTCVQVLNGDKNNALVKEFAWDPTEPEATRPLTFRYAEKSLMLFYAFDGNKNVSDVFFLALQNGIGAHYEYAPFGAVTRTAKATSSKVDLIGANPWRFSSEFYDSELDLVYYNYRHYSPALGRFLSRDPIEEQGGLNLYAFVGNRLFLAIDTLGLFSFPLPPALRISMGNAFDYLSKCIKCPEGAKTKDGHYGAREYRTGKQYGTPTVNGCGPEGWVLHMVVPDKVVFAPGLGWISFTSACNAHDTCYGTCGSNKATCDSKMKEDTINICNKIPAVLGAERQTCLSAAENFYIVVSSLGNGAFDTAQDKYCKWEPCYE